MPAQRPSGTHDRAEIDVAGGGQLVDEVLAAAMFGPALDRFVVRLEAADHDVVGAVIVVAVTRCFVEEALAQRLVAIEIAVDGLDELSHGQGAIAEHMVLEDREAVGETADADTLDVAGVVASAAGVVVLAVRDAVVGEDAQKRRLSPVRKHPFENQVPFVLDVDEVVDLSSPRLEDFVER